jgi:hypothetical protein
MRRFLQTSATGTDQRFKALLASRVKKCAVALSGQGGRLSRGRGPLPFPVGISVSGGGQA